MNGLKNQYIFFNTAEALLKKKFLILMFVLFFSSLSVIYVYAIDKEEDIRFDLTTSFFTNISQDIKTDYIMSALRLMNTTKLDFEENKVDESDFYVYSLENLTLNLGSEIVFMQNLDFPDMDLDLFPIISLKASENTDSYELYNIKFSFEKGTIEQAKKNSRKIIERTIKKINDEFRVILNTYISFYLFKYDIFQTTVTNKNIQINEKLKHQIIIQLIDIIGYNKNNFNVLDINYSNFAINNTSDNNISKIRIIFAAGFFGFLLSIFIILINTSYKEYKLLAKTL